MIKITPDNYNIAVNRTPNFKGVFDVATQGLTYLNESPAIGATVIDVSSMALPRSIVDSKRGFNAGAETAIRETSGALNHAMIGTYGLLGTIIAANIVNSKYGIQTKNITADVQSARLYSDMWQTFSEQNRGAALNDKQMRVGFMEYVLGSLRSYNSDSNSLGGWSNLPKETIEKAKTIISGAVDNTKNEYKMPKEANKNLEALITSYTGTKQLYKIEFQDRTVSTNLKSVIDDAFALSKAFTTDKVKALYQTNDTKGIEQFLKSFGHYKGLSTLIGLGLGCAIGASVQPLNRYFTKKRTGSDGFVGVENDKNNNVQKSKAGLGLNKALAITSMGLLTLGALGGNVANIGRKIQFKGFIPSLDQFKLVYGITIMSRFMSARDNNELREGVFKDFLGYTNWLILGGFVSKMVANKINPDLLNVTNQDGNKSFFKWLANSSLKSQSEVLLSEAKKAGVDIFDNGKLRSFKAILKDTVEKVPQTKAKIRGINIAQIAGLLYSGIVLGWGIPKLNIYMTKKLNEKEENAPKTIEQMHAERLRIH